MSLRFAIGSRWIEIYLWSQLWLSAKDFIHIQYGHNSTRNLIRLMRDEHGKVWFKWRRNKTKRVR